MGSSKRLAAHYDMRAQHQEILRAARSGPLQSLTDRELALREQPITIYPQPYRVVQAWVRFGARAIRVDAKLARSTPLAAGIEFRAGDETFRCWVWGNAVSASSED
ncbi:hypothetical protein [Microbacterium sp. SA39]|uniref:hypothetical protein n=1 Tax=Microbacterium sp. SA39 TaxID=1263625 RepID=UPI0005FA7099|nr:hypothetical protein [Microbacterium sp. SA39]KJQ52519.1 hypothetical protein RS85_03409 [Microbacterium sp. SA39]